MTKRKQHTALVKPVDSDPSHVGQPNGWSDSRRESLQSAKCSKRQRLSKGNTAEDYSPTPVAAAEASIDELFSQARAKHQARNKSSQKAKPALQTARVAGSKDDIFNVGLPRQRRYDAEGLPVYTPEELNVGGGGDTDQCPFDCKCCF